MSLENIRVVPVMLLTIVKHLGISRLLLRAPGINKSGEIDSLVSSSIDNHINSIIISQWLFRRF